MWLDYQMSDELDYQNKKSATVTNTVVVVGKVIPNLSENLSLFLFQSLCLSVIFLKITSFFCGKSGIWGITYKNFFDIIEVA